MADNFGGGENIYYDENSNIVLIDPNSVKDSNGLKKDRVIKQENLVMYANLIAKSVPRTKLAGGQDLETSINNTTVATINFLKPTDKNVFDTSYTDEFTGAGSAQGQGINQIKFNNGQNPQQTNFVDTQILGIRDINVDIKFNGVPTVSMTLVDVQGKSLFQTGGNSPYSVFLYYPYPLFELILKGFYGKAIKYELMLLNFQASFEASTGNYIVNLKFIARTSAMLDDIRLGYLFALPHMYNLYNTPNITNGITSNSATASVQQNGTGVTIETNDEPTSKGLSKIKQVFEEYQRRGLIDKNVPVLTLNEMQIKLTKYTEFLNKEFDKLDFTNIVALERYRGSLKNFRIKIDGWSEKFLDSNKVLVLNESFKNIKLKQLKQLTNSVDGNEVESNADFSVKAEKELNTILENGLKEFNSVPTELCKSITLDQKAFNVEFFKEKFSIDDINFEATYYRQRGRQVTNPNTDVEFLKFKNLIISELQNNGTLLKVTPSGNVDITIGNRYYYTVVKETETIKNIDGQIVQKYKEESERLNKVLKDKVRTNGNVQDLQFRPTVRNVIGAIMASVDAFYQLMDDVHTNAWNQRENTARLKSVLTNNPSQEGKNVINTTRTNNPNYFVYPWPQFIQKKETSGKVEYEVTYPGSNATSESTQAYNPVIWPEVEFVEEYLKGVLEKEKDYATDVKPNTDLIVKYTPGHAIELPFKPVIYSQQRNSIVNYVYEMYERIYLNAFYSGLYYVNTNQDIVFTASDIETNNVVQSIPTGDLKNVIGNTLPTTTLYNYLKTTSNNETGELWTNFTAQNFVTPYIKDQVNNSWKLLSSRDFNASSTNPLKLKSLDNIKSVISDNTTNETTIFDTYPFIDESFAKKMQDQPNKDNRYSTVKSYGFNDKKLVIDNFSGPKIVPLTRNITSNIGYVNTQSTNQIIIDFYEGRFTDKSKKFYTEGNLTYTADTNLTRTQTTSLLNTPYFINAIVDAGDSSGNEKYTKLGYLLLNSLPLSTLHEKYIDSTNGVPTEYMFANLNKFSAIHELPYAWILKIGSIWYRYKKYIENNEDILSSIWKDFDYRTNYDPITSAATKTYDIIYGSANSGKKPFTLLGSNTIQNGFYPKVINNFYKILTNNNLFVNTNGDLTYNLDDVDVLFGQELIIKSDTNISQIRGPITNWYSYLNIIEKFTSDFGPQYQGYKCLFPSAGVQPFQQTYFELRPVGDLTDVTISEVSGLNQMYNGGVKTFWNAPNYGWFDNSKVKKPTPLEYLKYVRTGTNENQPDFDIASTYSSIEDLFGVFTKDQLDSFETEFKEFCKTDGESKIFSPEGDDTTYANIVNIFKKMFLVNPETDTSNTILANTQAANINNVLSKFIDIKVYFKNGNPKKFDRQQFGYFSKNTNFEPTQPSTYQSYTGDTNPLPSEGGKTVQQSKNTDPEAWIALQEYVGFSTIEGIEYTQTSTVYDFFRDNQIPFRSGNIKLLYPLIRIYATQKKLNPSYNPTTFATDITNILNVAETKRNAIEQQFRGKLPSSLSGLKQEETQNINSKLDGDIIKLEQWELFKAVNDKWVAGRDTKTKLLFEEFLFFDRANRDIGDELIISTDTIRKYCTWDNSSNSVMSLIRQILSDNRMNFFVMPAYINFYGKSTPNNTDRNSSIVNNANDVFSSFAYVDYINSAPKFLCQYIDRPSQTLSLDNDPNYPFKSDSFDLGNPTNNPILQQGSTNEKNSNKAVGFVVDFGTVNQSIFKSVDINQEQGVASSEQIQTTIDLGNQGSGKKVMQQTTSMYDFYKNRSYTSTVKTLGNVMIQPTMYFVLRHMPMFNGTYIIRNVKHSISPGSFNTEFNGQRVSTSINTKVSDELASINQDFSKKLSEKVKQFVSNNTLVTLQDKSNQYLTGNAAKNYVLSGRTPYQGFIVQTKNSQTQDCFENVNVLYGDMTNADLITSSITVNNLVTLISGATTDTNLRTYMFCMLYMMGNTTEITQRLQYKQNNLYGVIVDTPPKGATASLIKKYRCLTTGENIVRPFATFDNIEDGINYIRDVYKNLIQSYFKDAKTDDNKIESIIKLFYDTWYTSGASTKKYTDNSNYNTWLGNSRWAYKQAKIFGLY
jgi:hypothetical protein